MWNEDGASDGWQEVELPPSIVEKNVRGYYKEIDDGRLRVSTGEHEHLGMHLTVSHTHRLPTKKELLEAWVSFGPGTEEPAMFDRSEIAETAIHLWENDIEADGETRL